MKYLQLLEKLRSQLRPSTYRFLLAELTVHYFSRSNYTLTMIKTKTNQVLGNHKVDSISLGFVRNVLKGK